MKDKTRKVIGNFLIIGIIFLIVFIFSIWFYAKFVKKDPGVTEQVTSGQNQAQTFQILTEEQLEEISNQLNTAKDNPFVVVIYEDVTKIELADLFYNGAGIATNSLTEEEKMQLTEQWRKEQMSNSSSGSTSAFLNGNVLKLKRTDMEQYLKEKTGKERSVSKEETGIGTYLESEDSYYLVRTGTSFDPVFCDEGVLMPDGTYYVKYHKLLASSTTSYTIQMKKENDQFVFLSNLKNEE